MNSLAVKLKNYNIIKTSAVDIFLFSAVYLIPTFSHIIGYPLYIFEPMRIALILCLVHTSKKNTYFVALTLPLYSFIFSAHPVFLKSLLISSELVLNVFFFFLINQKTNKVLPAALFSIIISKVIYYLLKFFLIESALLVSGLISTSLYIQLLVTAGLAVYTYIFYPGGNSEHNQSC